MNRPLIREQALGEALDPDKLERVLALLLRLKDLRQLTASS